MSPRRLLKASGKTATKPVSTTRLSVDRESLAQRALARAELNLDEVSLSFVRSAAGKSLTRDYSNYRTDKLLLIRQLLAGAELCLRGITPSFTLIQDIYYGIDEFLDFAADVEYARGAIQSVADITYQTAKDFEAFYMARFPGRTVNRKRFGKIRSIVSKLREKYGREGRFGESFDWPSGPRSNDIPTDSYSMEVFNRLAAAALSDIRFVMGEWKRLKKGWKAIPVVALHEKSIPDICLELRYIEARFAERGRSDKYESERRNRIAKNVEAQRVAERANLTIREFVDLYITAGEELSRSGVVFPSYKVSSNKGFSGFDLEWSWDIATRTTAEFYPGWPFKMAVSEADALVSFSRLGELRAQKRREEVATYTVLQSMRFGSTQRPFEVGVDAFFARTYFTASTLYPFYLYVQINTGWNEEVVASISLNLAGHIQDDILDPNYVLIWGWKNKVEKPMSHRSSRTDPLSVFNILQFVKSVRDEQLMADRDESESLWSFVLSKNLWTKNDQYIGQLSSATTGPVSAAFLARHGIDVGSQSKQPRIEARRLRTTCETRRRESGLSIDEVSTLLGHASVDTTELHYDSDAAAVELKNRRIRALQNDLVSDLRHYRARLLSSTSLQALREALNQESARSDVLANGQGSQSGQLTEPEIVHLLSPRGQTYIIACCDSSSPTWPNARSFVPDGDMCRFFNRCCLCDKGVIFEQALPYIARRVLDLERLKTGLSTGDWLNNYAEEADAWQAILDDWNDRDAVQRAQSQCFKLEYTLPLSLRGGQ